MRFRSHRSDRRLRFESLEGRKLLASDVMCNFDMPTDVNADTNVTPLDALAIVNFIGQRTLAGEGEPGGDAAPQMFMDVNDDGSVSPIDVLQVVNDLNGNANPERAPVNLGTAPLGTANSLQASGEEDMDEMEDDDMDDMEEDDTEEVEEEISYVATLSDANGASADVEFEIETENGITEMEFEVEVSGAAPNSSLDVTVGGVLVGQITTDENGEGSLEFSTEEDEDDESNAPFPSDFPTIAEGTEVTVGDTLSGTLQLEEEDEEEDDDED